MNKDSLFAVIILTVVWIILRENFSVATIAIGIVISVGSIYFYRKFIPQPVIEGIVPMWFAVYLFYLIWEIYLAGFSAIRFIFTGARAEIFEVKTKLSSVFLRTLLANSITLVPGSISLKLNDDMITVLWLADKKEDSRHIEDAHKLVKGKLEKMLLKMQK